MRKIGIVVIIGIILLMASSAIAGQKEVIKAVEKLRAATSSDVGDEKLQDLLIDAKTEVAIYARSLNIPEGKTSNDKFLVSAGSSVLLYEAGFRFLRAESYDKAEDGFNRAGKYLDTAYKHMRK